MTVTIRVTPKDAARLELWFNKLALEALISIKFLLIDYKNKALKQNHLNENFLFVLLVLNINQFWSFYNARMPML